MTVAAALRLTVARLKATTDSDSENRGTRTSVPPRCALVLTAAVTVARGLDRLGIMMMAQVRPRQSLAEAVGRRVAARRGNLE